MDQSAASAVLAHLFSGANEAPPREIRERRRKVGRGRYNVQPAIKDVAIHEPAVAITRGRAGEEARAMFQLVGQNGETVRSVRESIAVADKQRMVLWAFIEANPEAGSRFKFILRFRDLVLEEFDRIAALSENVELIAECEAQAAKRALAPTLQPVLPVLAVPSEAFTQGGVVFGAGIVPADPQPRACHFPQ